MARVPRELARLRANVSPWRQLELCGGLFAEREVEDLLDLRTALLVVERLGAQNEVRVPVDPVPIRNDRARARKMIGQPTVLRDQ